MTQIPVNWKIKIQREEGAPELEEGEEPQLPEEFAISHWEGHLTPCQETRVNVTFKSITQKKIEQLLILDV